MKRRFSALYWLIPIVYIGVIFFFLYVQFSARDKFQQKVGTLTVAGVSSRGNLFFPEGIHELSLRFDLAEVLFSDRRPLILHTSTGQELQPRLESYSAFPQGVQVRFADGLQLRFNLKGDLGDQVCIEPELPEGTDSISLPLTIRGGRVEEVRGIPMLMVAGTSGRYFISLPYGASFDADSQRLTLPSGPQESGVSIERIGRDDRSPYLHWFSRNAGFVDEPAYREGVSSFLDRTYRAWKTRQPAPDDGPDGAERLGSAMLSESLLRGEYQDLRLSFFRTLATLRERNTAWVLPNRMTPYVGGLDLYTRELQRRTPERIEEITSMIRRSDFTVFRTPDLVRFVLNHAPFSLIEELIRLADSVEAETADPGLLLQIVELYADVGSLISPAVSILPRITSILEERLLPSIRSTEDSLFLQQGETVDVLLCIEAGSLLVRLGELLSRSDLAPIGRNLILSALRLADSRGFLPARLTSSGDGPVRPEGRLSPEVIYHRVAPTTYLPREIPLYRELNPGAWIWTASSRTTVEIDESTCRFTFTFPPGSMHYLLVQGLKPFQELRLHGIPWKTDPTYFRYSDGWFYDEASQTLFLKLTHRQEIEELLISYP